MPLNQALQFASAWYRRRNAGEDPRAITLEQIKQFMQLS